MRFRELEYKYKALCTRKEFIEIVYRMFYVKRVEIFNGTDYFFKGFNTRTLARARVTHGIPGAELTVKNQDSRSKGVTDRNEIDIHTNESDMEVITQFYSALGYEFEFNIYKDTTVVSVEGLEIAFYTVNEVDSYIEIEVVKGSFTERGEGHRRLRGAEKTLERLGLSSILRLDKNLYELCKAGG